MKNKNIINESFTRPLTGWTPEKCVKCFEKPIIKFFKKSDFVDSFNNFFVPTKFFNWKNVFKDAPKTEFSTGGKYGMKIILKYTYKLKLEEISSFIFGLSDNKTGGIIYNEEFEPYLNELGFKKSQDPNHIKDEEDFDDEDESDDESDDDESGNFDESVLINFKEAYKNIISEDDNFQTDFGDEDNNQIENYPENLSINITIGFNSFSLSNKINNKTKPKNKYNPNYISSMSGRILIEFSSNSNKSGAIKLGEITYYPKRTQNMDPIEKPSLGNEIKTLFNQKPNDNGAASDFGLIGVLAKHAFKGAAGSVVNSFSTIQDESIEVDLDEKFNHENGLIDKNDEISNAFNTSKNPAKNKKDNKLEKLNEMLNDSIGDEYKTNINVASNHKSYEVMISTKSGEKLFTIIGNIG